MMMMMIIIIMIITITITLITIIYTPIITTITTFEKLLSHWKQPQRNKQRENRNETNGMTPHQRSLHGPRVRALVVF